MPIAAPKHFHKLPLIWSLTTNKQYLYDLAAAGISAAVVAVELYSSGQVTAQEVPAVQIGANALLQIRMRNKRNIRDILNLDVKILEILTII